MEYSFNKGIFEQILGKTKGLIFPSEKNNHRSRFLQSNVLLYCVVLLLFLKVAVTLISINFPQNIFFADVTKYALENFINQTRQSVGLNPLKPNEKLNQAAQLKAENMVQNQYFSHTSPTGLTPWFWFAKAGYSYKYAGENLAVGFYESEEVYRAWLNSPSHKANIINPNYTEVGTAVMSGFGGGLPGQGNTIVVVQTFASPLPIKTTQPEQTQLPAKTEVVQAPEQTVSPNNNGKVLSQSVITETVKEAGTNSVQSKVISSVLYDYENILQNIVYGASLVVIGVLLILIFFNFEIKFKRELVFRAFLVVVLLSAATLLNKEIIIAFIPHQIII